MAFKKNASVKVVTDTCGDLPPSLIGRYGVIVSRSKSNDSEFAEAYKVRFAGWRNPKVLFSDEITLVTKK